MRRVRRCARLFGLGVLVLLATSPPAFAWQAPTVAIEINRTPDAADDYVTWAPTFCQAKVTGGVAAGTELVVTLSNAATNTTGRVRFAAGQSPWPANTTATSADVTLNLPADGTPVPFAIAGEFGRASTRARDTAIVARTSDGTEVGRQSLMVRVRKDARRLTFAERAALLEALRRLHLVDRRYDIYVSIHQLGNPEAHQGPAFLPWHRAFVLHLERALQRIDPAVTVPYWKYDVATAQTLPPDNLQVFGQNYLGADSANGFAFFAATNPLRTWRINGISGVYRDRATPNHTARPPVRSDAAVLTPSTYTPFVLGDGTFQNPGLEVDPHGSAHGWAGWVNGWIRLVNISPRDPLFFFLHSNVDRQWAAWQRRYGRFGATAADYAPTGAYRTNIQPRVRIGHFREETMWPWNGRRGNPNTPADPFDDRPQDAPGGPFPPAAPFTLGPPAEPRPADMIDYLGRAEPARGLGFCYDDVPYELIALRALDVVALAAPKVAQPPPEADLVLDPGRSLVERLGAVPALIRADERQATRAVAALRDAKVDPRLRLAILRTIGNTARPDVLDASLAIAAERNAPRELRRMAADQVVFALDFTPAGQLRRGQLLDSLRGLLEDSHLPAREVAAGALVATGDDAAIQRIAAGIQDPNRAVLSEAAALGLLANARQPAYFELFRNIFSSSIDLETRIAAARGLGRFPEGIAPLRAAAVDPQQAPALRLAALEALNANDPDALQAAASTIVADAAAPADLRGFALSALADLLEGRRADGRLGDAGTDRFLADARGLAGGDPNPTIREAAWDLLRRNDPGFKGYAEQLIANEKDLSVRFGWQAQLVRAWAASEVGR